MPGAPTAAPIKNTCPPSFQENNVSSYYGSTNYDVQAYSYQAPRAATYTGQPSYDTSGYAGAAVTPFAAQPQNAAPYQQPYTAQSYAPQTTYQQTAQYAAQPAAVAAAYSQPSYQQASQYAAQPAPAAAYSQPSYQQPSQYSTQPANASYSQPSFTAQPYQRPPVTQAKQVYQAQAVAQQPYQPPQNTDVQPSTTLVQVTGSVLPNSQGVKGRANVPMGVVYSLMRESSLPVVNPQGSRLVRCIKCRGYMNCYIQFTDNGSKWTCNLCSTVNETPNEYYCQLSSTGERQDKFERPELNQPAVEYVASPDYMTRPPMAPSYVVLLDVSRASVQSGFVHTVCQSLKSVIEKEKYAGIARAQFGIITYDTNVHFYTPGSGDTPQISVVTGNSKDVFLPSGELLVHIKDNQDKLTKLLDHIPTYWTDQSSEDSCVAAALAAARMVLRSCGGKIIMCQCSLPLAPELGLNPSHDMRKKDSRGRVTAHGSLPDPVDGVKPSSAFFSNMASNMAQCQIMADVFVAPPSAVQMDLATLGSLARYSGGQMYYYPPSPNQESVTHTQDILRDLETSMNEVVGWEGVIRVRCSKGWKITKYHGNYNFRSVDLIMLPAFTTNQTVSVQFDISDSVTTDKKFYAQAAVLYTTSSGERRIRVVTHCVQTSPNLRDVAASVNLLPTLHLITQNALDEAIAGKLADARSYIHNQVRHLISLLGLLSPASGVSEYENTTGTQQQCSMYSAALMKCSAFKDGRDVSADERVVAWNKIRSYTIEEVYQYLLPTLMEVSQQPQEILPERAPPRFS